MSTCLDVGGCEGSGAAEGGGDGYDEKSGGEEAAREHGCCSVSVGFVKLFGIVVVVSCEEKSRLCWCHEG